MFSIRTLTLAAILFGLAAVLVGGCGQQDLYEPPGAPYTIRGRLALPSSGEDAQVIGDYAFVAGGEAGLVVVDISDRSAPRWQTMVNTDKHALSVDVTRTFYGHEIHDVAYVCDQTEGVVFFDVTDPLQPERLGKTETYNALGNCLVEPENLDEPHWNFVPDGWHGVVFARADTSRPGVVNYFGDNPTLGEAHGLAFRDGWGYVADNHMGLVVMDLRVIEEDAIDVVAWADTPGAARDVVLDGDYAFVADGIEGLAVLRIDGGATPVRVAQFDLSGYSEDIEIRDDLVAIASNLGGVHFLDVSEPESPTYLGTIATSYALGVCFADDGTCLITDQDEGLIVCEGHGPFRDTRPPARVSSLKATPLGETTVRLDWFATGSDRMWGQADSVIVRTASTPILDEGAWDDATPLVTLPAAAPGGAMQYQIGGLQPGTTYHYALKVTDAAGHVSGLSNDDSTSTLEGIFLDAPGLSPEAGIASDTFTFEVTCYWPRSLTAHEVIVDGEPHAMTNAEPSGEGDGGVYRFETTLDRGEHTYAFRFAGEGSEVLTETFDGPVVGTAAFLMGSPAGEPGRDDDETLHRVVFQHDLLAADHEVTQAEWAATWAAYDPQTLPDPSEFQGADRPVERVTWLEAVQYCNALSAVDGLQPCYTIAGEIVTWDTAADGWRLPTEAEWEFLCRAGTTTAFYNGDADGDNLFCRLNTTLDAIGWYCGNTATAGTHDVGQKTANDEGLVDMAGNVREWCWDWYGELGTAPVLDPVGSAGGTRRVCRGGSWEGYAQDCRSAARGTYFPDSRDNTVGFRVVRTLFTD